jgi:predicted SAM-dependent methyltransferase
MIKYFLTAFILKGFSTTGFSRAWYRRLGNFFGARKRARGKMPEYYAAGVRQMIELTDKYSVFKDGQIILEVGTGWMHWEAITMSLFFDIKAVLFDVWDNRQLIALKNYLLQFGEIIPQWNEVSQYRKDRARNLIKKICQAASFEEIYQILGFKYLVVSSGSLQSLADCSFDVVVSARVLEHIGRDTADQFARDCHRILTPGGYSMHSICIGDHLIAYAKNVSPKQYLTYPDKTWRRWFENGVQYINRLQKPEWLDVFGKTGMRLVESRDTTVDISNLKITNQYKRFSNSDLMCYTLMMLHQKAPNNDTKTAC